MNTDDDSPYEPPTGCMPSDSHHPIIQLDEDLSHPFVLSLTQNQINQM